MNMHPTITKTLNNYYDMFRFVVRIVIATAVFS